MLDTRETIRCPACGEPNLAVARRCGSCAAPLRASAAPAHAADHGAEAGGAATSPANPAHPAPFAIGYAGRPPLTPERAAELRRHAAKASGSLVAIAAIYAAVAAVMLLGAGSPGTSPVVASRLLELVTEGAVLVALFLGLALWARLQPMAAAVTALAVVVLLLGFDLFAWLFGPRAPRPRPDAAAAAWSARLLGRGVGIVIRMVVAALVVRAIGHAMARRQLLRDR